MPASALYVGIDVAKSKLDVCFLDAHEAPVRSNAVYPNRPCGWTAMLRTLEKLGAPQRYSVHCAMESTGVYHEALSRHLSTQTRIPMAVSVLNPRGVKHFAKAMLKDTKTDKVDTRLIAQYTIRMKPKPVFAGDEEQRSLKELTRARRRLMEDRSKEVNRLHTALHRHFPGYQSSLGKEFSASLLAILSDLQSPRAILAQSLDDLSNRKIGPRHRVRRAIAIRLQEVAREAPVQDLGKGTELLIGMRARRIRQLDGQLKEIESCIEQLVAEMDAGKLLSSIPGLGPVTVATILAEVGDIRRFKSKEALVGYCGLYATVWESGEAKRTYKMSRKGNRWLKTALLVVSGPARIHNPAIAAYNQRLCSRGKSTKAAGGALARKLTHLIWAIMTRGEPWSAAKAQQGLDKAEAMLAS
jgi:transposase